MSVLTADIGFYTLVLPGKRRKLIVFAGVLKITSGVITRDLTRSWNH